MNLFKKKFSKLIAFRKKPDPIPTKPLGKGIALKYSIATICISVTLALLGVYALSVFVHEALPNERALMWATLKDFNSWLKYGWILFITPALINSIIIYIRKDTGSELAEGSGSENIEQKIKMHKALRFASRLLYSLYPILLFLFCFAKAISDKYHLEWSQYIGWLSYLIIFHCLFFTINYFSIMFIGIALKYYETVTINVHEI